MCVFIGKPALVGRQLKSLLNLHSNKFDFHAICDKVTMFFLCDNLKKNSLQIQLWLENEKHIYMYDKKIHIEYKCFGKKSNKEVQLRSFWK